MGNITSPKERLKEIEKDIPHYGQAWTDDLNYLISRIRELEAALMWIASEKKAGFTHSRKSRLLAQRVLVGEAE